MAKRKMPAHIVLPNGMWRFVKAGAKKAKALSKPARSKRTKRRSSRGAVSVVRHRKAGRRGVKGMLGGAGIAGLARSALIGIGSAHVAGYVPVNVPYKEEMAGAIGAYMTGGKNIKSAIVGAGAVYLTKMAQGTTSNAGNPAGNMN